MWSVPSVGQAFSPLDEKLALLPTSYSPTLVETMVRLATRLPFAQVADELARLYGVTVSADTVRRLTEEAGTYQVAIEERALTQLEQEAPEEAEGPAVQQVSADGVMVSLVDGSWTEVRVMALGTVTAQEGKPQVEDLTYFSRHCTAQEFIRQATVPTAECGTRQAETVVAVMAPRGYPATWLQTLIDRQCPQAVRILDFPHAVSYLSQAAHAAFGAGSREAAVWLDVWAPKLKRDTPEQVLTAIRALPTPSPEAEETQREALQYLEARIEQLRYAPFQEQGYPIGSGIVESACKVVVQVRLKGSGMHWAASHLNPLLALRGRLCSGTWTATWAGIAQEWRQQTQQRRQRGRERRRAQRAQRQAAQQAEQTGPEAQTPTREHVPTIVDGRPTMAHPWKRAPVVTPHDPVRTSCGAPTATRAPHDVRTASGRADPREAQWAAAPTCGMTVWLLHGKAVGHWLAPAPLYRRIPWQGALFEERTSPPLPPGPMLDALQQSRKMPLGPFPFPFHASDDKVTRPPRGVDSGGV